jgi:hypothetical protein
MNFKDMINYNPGFAVNPTPPPDSKRIPTRDIRAPAPPTPPTPPAQPPSPLDKLHRTAKEALEQNLAPGEKVEVVIIGMSPRAIVGTERRAFVFKKGWLAGAPRSDPN